MSAQEKNLSIYEYADPGYRPLLESAGWTVACLNYLEAARPENVTDLERHLFSDEVFLLVAGEADLIIPGEQLEFVPLEKGKAYRVAPGVWHGLAMQEGAQCFIVKSVDPPQNRDVSHRDLTEKEMQELRQHYRL